MAEIVTDENRNLLECKFGGKTGMYFWILQWFGNILALPQNLAVAQW
jgi:hypothetical protein